MRRPVWRRILLRGCAISLMGAPAAGAGQPAQVIAVDGGMIAVPSPGPDGVIRLKGVPYAAPPVGMLRWRPPAPVVPWEGVRATARFAADCMQKPSDRASPAANRRSEDCLYLNVWRAAEPKAGRPVFLWIHGGGSREGSGAQPQFDGTALARKGVVVVTINYRLGPLGFLSTRALSAESGYGASGNYGLMDDLAALRWVQRNIGAFGGDPRRVTVGGESSGAVSTGVLMASPLAAGLFHQAIGESGSVFRIAGFGSMGAQGLAFEESKGETLMARVGARDLAALRAVPATTLLAAADGMGVFFNLPVVDGHVLPDSPWHVFAAHRQNDVPLLVGWNADEGSLERMADHWTLASLLKRFYGPSAPEVAALYPEATPGDIDVATEAVGDNAIAYSTWKWAVAQERFGKHPVYLYRFDRAPPVPDGAFGPALDARLAGAFHGSEMVYVFDTLASQPRWAITADDRRIAAQMSAYWANFITTGSPDGPGLPAWPPYNEAAGPQRMRIGLVTKAEPDPDHARFAALMAAHAHVDAPDPAPPGR
jgi:para-nitrobenzyl esterase